MYLLEETYYFYLLATIPVVVLLFILTALWKKHAQKRFAGSKALKRLSPDKSTFKPAVKLVLVCLALFSMVIALVNPKIGTKIETVKREGVDVVFAIDVSKSMDAEDVAPNRIEKSKQLVSQILGTLGGDRIGIIGYAGSAFPQLPITTDFGAARMFLSAMNTDMVSSQGTAIAEAIRLAATYYDDEEQTNRILFIISDGEDHEGNTASVIDQAVKDGIKIYTIGVGTPSGSPIPIKRNGILQEYKRDRNGDRVITQLDETTLQEIARQGNGGYISGNNTAEVVNRVKTILNETNKTEFEAKQFADFKDQFQWFIGIALLLLLLDIFFLERKTTWLRRLNLFNEKQDE